MEKFFNYNGLNIKRGGNNQVVFDTREDPNKKMGVIFTFTVKFILYLGGQLFSSIISVALKNYFGPSINLIYISSLAFRMSLQVYSTLVEPHAVYSAVF